MSEFLKEEIENQVGQSSHVYMHFPPHLVFAYSINQGVVQLNFETSFWCICSSLCERMVYKSTKCKNKLRGLLLIKQAPEAEGCARETGEIEFLKAF